MNAYRAGLPALPARMQHLPIDERGYPVPWFVSWPNGKPEFRIADGDKMTRAMRFGNCWVCGEPTGRLRTFVIGPMCAVNRTTAEPPCHIECARYSATACPFLTLPKAKRNTANMPEGHVPPAGEMIERNPGVTCLWTVHEWRLIRVDNGVLYRLGKPDAVEWYSQKRRATRDEVLESINSGMPILREMAVRESPRACDLLEAHLADARVHLPEY